MSGRAGFRWLWAGQTASMLGTAVSVLALPSVAILTMHASAFQVGALEAAQFAAYPVLGLVAGVWIDRWSRRTTMMVADVVRALALASVPLAAALHALTFVQLAAVALVVGTASVFFDVSYQALVPALVEPSRLEDANARLEGSNSVAMLVGSGLGGALVGAIGAALAVAVDALSYVVSIVSLCAIRVHETHRDGVARAAPEPFRAALFEGLRTVFGSPVLRAIGGATACVNLGWAIVSAVFLLFFYRVLHFSPGLVGAILALGNVGFVGALAAPRLARRIPAGRLMLWTLLTGITATFAIPVATLLSPIPVIVAVQLAAAFSIPVYNITQVSLRQRTVPAALHGRMNATMKTLVWGVMPVGALLGGALGNTVGIVPTIVVGACVMLSAIPWLLVPQIRELGAAPAAEAA